MSTIFGLFSKSGFSIDRHQFEDAMQKLGYWKPDRSGSWINRNIGFGHHELFTDSSTFSEELPFFQNQYQCAITADARIDYREELSFKLKDLYEPDNSISDSQLVLRAYNKWGVDCVKHIFGDFAFAIWNDVSKKLFCARDHMGTRPLYYFNSEDYFIFSSDLRGIIDLPYVKQKINEQWISDALTTIIPEKNLTAYENVFRLEPSHYLEVNCNSMQIKKYWDLQIQSEYTQISEEEAIIGLRERIINSINERMRTSYSIGVELSGGLDSSGIATLAQQFPKGKGVELTAYTNAMSSKMKEDYYPFGDDAEYSKRLIEFSNIENHKMITGENVGSYNSVLYHMELFPSPILQIYAILSDQLFEEMNSRGERILFSGLGGDEGISSKAPGFLDELISNRDWKLLRSELRVRHKNSKLSYNKAIIKSLVLSKLPIFRKVLSLISFRRNYLKKKYKEFAIDKTFERKIKSKHRYNKTILKQNPPSVREIQYLKIHDNHISNRMENSYVAARSMKIEYRYPFLDVKLLEYYYSLPKEYKYKNGIGRYLYREAMKEILPEEIRKRLDKSGAIIPSIQYRLMKDETHFRELIRESENTNSYHYVDYKRLDHMLDKIISRNDRKLIRIGARIFFNSISILVLQKWQREGKIDIGIKC